MSKARSACSNLGYAAVSLVALSSIAAAPPNTDPIRIVAPEMAHLDLTRTDGGLAPFLGAETFVVFRADNEHPDQSDEKGWTYHHHPDLACWKGRLYIGWDSCERDEDTWPSRELFSTSSDGKHWDRPRELFPQGVSTPLRMYFFHAPNGRMLAIAGLRMNQELTRENTKGPLVVREIRSDHTLGPVFTLRAPETNPLTPPPPNFSSSKDGGFVQACEQLRSDHLFLEQQDNGSLLAPADRIKWRDPSLWEGNDDLRKEAADWGKGQCFFRRKDGALVGVSKKGWVTVSQDAGRTWSQPVRPPSLVTGMGKVWGQATPNGRYLLAYDPDYKMRFPLAVVTSDDGITFDQMRVVHGLLPSTRYPGRAKSPGASYVRGLSLWSNDGTRKENAVWLVYSVNKEEIWISRLPF